MPNANAVVCRNKRCPNRNEVIALHADTILPIHCGGCGGVLVADPDAPPPEPPVLVADQLASIVDRRLTELGLLKAKKKGK